MKGQQSDAPEERLCFYAVEYFAILGGRFRADDISGSVAAQPSAGQRIRPKHRVYRRAVHRNVRGLRDGSGRGDDRGSVELVW